MTENFCKQTVREHNVGHLFFSEQAHLITICEYSLSHVRGKKREERKKKVNKHHDYIYDNTR